RWLIVVSMPLATPRPNAIRSLRSLADSWREPDDWSQQTAQAGEQRRQADQGNRNRQHALPRKLHQLIVTEARQRAAYPDEDQEDDGSLGDQHTRQERPDQVVE